jgi:transposase, IS5 family
MGHSRHLIVVQSSSARPTTSDRDLLIPAIQTHQAKLVRVPRLVATDGGFYSARNEAAAKRCGSSVCAFPIA